MGRAGIPKKNTRQPDQPPAFLTPRSPPSHPVPEAEDVGAVHAELLHQLVVGAHRHLRKQAERGREEGMKKKKLGEDWDIFHPLGTARLQSEGASYSSQRKGLKNSRDAPVEKVPRARLPPPSSAEVARPALTTADGMALP